MKRQYLPDNLISALSCINSLKSHSKHNSAILHIAEGEIKAILNNTFTLITELVNGGVRAWVKVYGKESYWLKSIAFSVLYILTVVWLC